MSVRSYRDCRDRDGRVVYGFAVGFLVLVSTRLYGFIEFLRPHGVVRFRLKEPN